MSFTYSLLGIKSSDDAVDVQGWKEARGGVTRCQQAAGCRLVLPHSGIAIEYWPFISIKCRLYPRMMHLVQVKGARV